MKNKYLNISRVFIFFFILTTFLPEISAAAQKKSLDTVTIHLKNGNAMSCQIKSETKTAMTVVWQGLEMTLQKNEIARIDRGGAIKGDGMVIAERQTQDPSKVFKNNPIVRLKNGQAIDGVISEIRSDTIVTGQDLGDGAFAYQDIPAKNVELLEFLPVSSPADQKAKEELKALFPKMKTFELGFVTLLTDTEGSSLKEIKKLIRDQNEAVYRQFFDLFKGRKPQHQLFVVAFDRFQDYAKAAAERGVPAQLCPGFFLPSAKTLFMVNFMGDEFSANIYEAVTGVRGQIDRFKKMYQHGDASSSRNIQIEGIAKELNARFDSAFAYIQGIFSDETSTVLRHEITHGIFNNFGIQSVEVSKTKVDPKAVVEPQDKKEFILSLLESRAKTSADEKDLAASNSWFVEGTAEYASTSGIDQPNPSRLYRLKEVQKKNELWPLSQLTVFKMGSFPGVCTDAMLSGYAQSWGFVNFLMTQYRSGFMKYLNRMSREKTGLGDDLKWLLEALGKDLKTLEAEWSAYVTSLPPAEDPFVDQIVKVREILYKQ